MSYGPPEIEQTPPCPHCEARVVFRAIAPPGQREQPVYLRCCECWPRPNSPVTSRQIGLASISGFESGEERAALFAKPHEGCREPHFPSPTSKRRSWARCGLFSRCSRGSARFCQLPAPLP
jgi:hypothetical protein